MRSIAPPPLSKSLNFFNFALTGSWWTLYNVLLQNILLHPSRPDMPERRRVRTVRGAVRSAEAEIFVIRWSLKSSE